MLGNIFGLLFVESLKGLSKGSKSSYRRTYHSNSYKKHSRSYRRKRFKG